MKNVTACVFPDTLPDEGLLFPLVQVFGKIVYLQAVEDEPLAQGVSTPFIEQLLQQGTLQLCTPVPLGEQRDRFLALTGDMQKRRDDYTNQLSMLTLAGLSRREQTETKNSIITSLLQSGKIDNRNEDEELWLWQSRLMLKLGEFFDAEQSELHEALQNITSRQDDLLAELREESDRPFALAASLHDSDLNSDAILQHRLKAWSRLAFFQDTTPPPTEVFITGHETAMETIQEIFERNHQQRAQKLATLELPAKRNSEALDSLPLTPLIRRCADLQAALGTINASPSQQLAAVAKCFVEGASEWSHDLKTRYPAAQYDRCTLDIFLFPKISARQLFLESFASISPAEDDTSQTAAGALVGLLNRASTPA